jgi:hypothetical protein
MFAAFPLSSGEGARTGGRGPVVATRHGSTLVHRPEASGRSGARSQLKVDARKKMERNVPLRLQACCNDKKIEKPVFGLKPETGTQRFLLWIRSRRARVDRPAIGCGCYASFRARAVVPPGLAQSSRKKWILDPPPAGAAHGSGSSDKLASLILSLPKPSEAHMEHN